MIQRRIHLGADRTAIVILILARIDGFEEKTTGILFSVEEDIKETSFLQSNKTVVRRVRL